MRTPFKTLTIGLVLATAAMAGCSSTTGSSGAVQNDATASAAASSSAASTGPAPSPDPVTPSPAPTEASASPVASPTDLPSPSGSSAGPAVLGGSQSGPGSNDVCDSGMEYGCGDIGASGVGIVFYANSTAFPCVANGVDMTSSCNYLEVAPQTWNGTLVKCTGGCGGSSDLTSDWGNDGPGTGSGYGYCSGSGQTSVIPNASGTLIGTGYPNTSAMLTMCDSGKSVNAAEQVRGYNGGGMTDWSLPSQDELNALYYYTGRNAIGGFAASSYWSSSQQTKTTAWYQWFSNGSQGSSGSKTNTSGVRPVRAF
jgi:Protein of unknown function (DUF1566)